MQMAVRPASVSTLVGALAAVTVAVENACAARPWLKQVSEGQQSWCQLRVRFEAAQQARFIGSNTAWYLLLSASKKQWLFTQRLTAWTSFASDRG